LRAGRSPRIANLETGGAHPNRWRMTRPIRRCDRSRRPSRVAGTRRRRKRSRGTGDAESPSGDRLPRRRAVSSGLHADVVRWRSWLDGPIRSDVIGMHHRRYIWRRVGEIAEATPEVGDRPSVTGRRHDWNVAKATAGRHAGRPHQERDACVAERFRTARRSSGSMACVVQNPRKADCTLNCSVSGIGIPDLHVNRTAEPSCVHP
jgi:hypothetical protein